MLVPMVTRSRWLRIPTLAASLLWLAACSSPEPPRASPTAVDRIFLCLGFRPDSAELDARCQQILYALVELWAGNGGRIEEDCPNPPSFRSPPRFEDFSGPSARIEVSGHADRAEQARGTACAVAGARADAARRFLMLQCIPAGAIGVASRGAERPLVPTRPNTPEAQNRRVEINRFR
jgi:hypothetical protein